MEMAARRRKGGLELQQEEIRLFSIIRLILEGGWIIDAHTLE